jgi:hypothetical protein
MSISLQAAEREAGRTQRDDEQGLEALTEAERTWGSALDELLLQQI